MVEEGSQSKQVEAPPSIEVIIICYLFTRYMIDIRKLGSYRPGVASGGSLVAIVCGQWFGVGHGQSA